MTLPTAYVTGLFGKAAPAIRFERPIRTVVRGLSVCHGRRLRVNPAKQAYRAVYTLCRCDVGVSSPAPGDDLANMLRVLADSPVLDCHRVLIRAI
jgi:hypothetical protein